MLVARACCFADAPSSHEGPPQDKLHHWRIITFAEASTSGDKKYPSFTVEGDDPTKGMSLGIDFSDPEGTKPNMISARLYRENGESVDSVGGNLNAPVPEPVTVSPPQRPGDPTPPPVAWTAWTSFP